MRSTHPYTPQENGTMERWWQTLERSKTQSLREPYLSQFFNECNYKWVLKGVVALTGKKWIPDEAWRNMSKYHNQPDAKFIYE